MYRFSFSLISFVFLSLQGFIAAAQHDTTYFVTFPDEITGRFYLSKKYTDMNFRDTGYDLKYRPNTTINMGFGATYKWATLNLAYGFDFLNPEKGKGDTDYLDLQFHAYGRKITTDFLGQYYKGFYLSPRGKATMPDNYYVRPDMRILATGISSQYILNHDRFSYQAAYHQNEWQKKSAGSFLFGFETYLGRVDTDSTLIPKVINDSLAQNNIHEIKFFELGPNAGYAYSLVIKEHFFITASAAVSLDYGKTAIRSSDGAENLSGVSPNLFLRGFCGYNSSLWGVSFVYINSGVNLSASSYPDRRVALNTGNFRVNIIRRFTPGRKTKKVLKYIDKVDKKF